VFENKQIQRKVNYWFAEADRSRHADQGDWAQARLQWCVLLKVALEVWGKDVSKAKRLRELEMVNGKLKRLLVNAHLGIHSLKSVFGTFDLLHKM